MAWKSNGQVTHDVMTQIGQGHKPNIWAHYLDNGCRCKLGCNGALLGDQLVTWPM